MIKANELRVGNWVRGSKNDVYQLPFQVTARDFAFPDFMNNVNGILLTPEILKNIGFTHFTLTARGVKRKHWKLSPNDSFYLYGVDFFYAPNVMPQIETVHQLQNLYFAMIGAELEIKLLNKVC